MDLGGFDEIWEKNHSFKNFLFKWNDKVMTVDILVVDAYSEMGLYMPI
jgi:hypothetical protein